MANNVKENQTEAIDYAGHSDIKFFRDDCQKRKEATREEQIAWDVLELIKHGYNEAKKWQKLGTFELFYAIFIERDQNKLRGARKAFREGFRYLYEQFKKIDDGKHFAEEDDSPDNQRHRQHLLIRSNCLSLLTYTDIKPGQLYQIPDWDEATRTWNLVSFKVKAIELTPSSGFDRLVIGESGRVFAYALEPMLKADQQHLKPSRHLVFMGTTYPVGQGFYAQIMAILEAFSTPGSRLYRQGRDNIKKYIDESYKQYDLELMSSLAGDINHATAGKVYLNKSPNAYFVKGMEQAIFLPEDIDLTNFEQKLKDADFKKKILAITSKAGHAHEIGVEIHGISLGGGTAFAAALDRDNYQDDEGNLARKISKVYAYNPPGLCEIPGVTNFQKDWDDLPYKPEVYVQTQDQDPISSRFGSWLVGWNIIRVIPTKETAAQYSALAHAVSYTYRNDTQFIKLSPEQISEENADRWWFNLLIYVIARGLLCFIALPLYYLAIPAMSAMRNHPIELAILVAITLTFITLPGLVSTPMGITVVALFCAYFAYQLMEPMAVLAGVKPAQIPKCHKSDDQEQEDQIADLSMT